MYTPLKKASHDRKYRYSESNHRQRSFCDRKITLQRQPRDITLWLLRSNTPCKLDLHLLLRANRMHRAKETALDNYKSHQD